jgi:hypothetical protein
VLISDLEQGEADLLHDVALYDLYPLKGDTNAVARYAAKATPPTSPPTRETPCAPSASMPP